MKMQGMGVVLVAGFLGAGPLVENTYAADMTRQTVTRTTRVTRVVPVVPERAIARLADRGLGYSVLHEGAGVPQRGYRVHVTCTVTETFAQTYCPTPAYQSYCPSATIVCR
ncbi:hypothetical protein [Microvirga pakistanensis]|uniref:hypothetical protein n=1 Tax=Microvirga pakistanensis TaxID=1682650 RepID=UPI00106B7DBC|nr:hypothetical protein [Microvirga pakistanensis]